MYARKTYVLGLLVLVFLSVSVRGRHLTAQSPYRLYLPLLSDTKTPTFTMYRLADHIDRRAENSVSDLHVGPDGQFWFAGELGMYRFMPPDKLTRYEGGIRSGIDKFVVGPDNAFWYTRMTYFSDAGASTVFRRSTTGESTDVYRITGGITSMITNGPDGALWFPILRPSEPRSGIGRITTSGEFTEFPITIDAIYPTDITTGPDGNLWFINNVLDYSDGGKPIRSSIIRMTTTGIMTEFIPPTPASSIVNIIAGPDGNLWFLEQAANQIGRITPQGDITEFPVPTPQSGLSKIIAAPDGNLWFTEFAGNKIGRITPSGQITEFEVPTTGCTPNEPCGGPIGLTIGPDGYLWFGTGPKARMGRIEGVLLVEKK